MSDERLSESLAGASLHQVRRIINEDVLAVDVAFSLLRSPLDATHLFMLMFVGLFTTYIGLIHFCKGIFVRSITGVAVFTLKYWRQCLHR